MEQRSDEWFQARCGIPTASMLKLICVKLKSGKYPASREEQAVQKAIERISNVPFPSFSNAAMQHGNDTEPAARAAYMAHTGAWVEEKGFIRHPEVDAGCSPDGLIGDDGGLEIKCPFNPARHFDARHKMPAEHKWQVQGSLWITGRQWWDFVSFDPRFPDHLQLFIHRQERDESLINDIAKEVNDFNILVEKFVKEMQ
jgi:hypothetical protein